VKISTNLSGKKSRTFLPAQRNEKFVMPRVFLPQIDFTDHIVSITGEKAHYLTSVLRCKKGDDLIIFDGKNRCIRTSVTKADRREVFAEVLEQYPCDLESPLNVILVQGLLKGEKMDMVVRMTTELGVKELIPVITERSQLRDTRKAARWRKIAEEAARQSGRSAVPVVRDPAEFKEWMDETGHGPRGDERMRRFGELKGFIFWEDNSLSLNDAIKEISSSPAQRFTSGPIYLLIGTEGGFSPEEVALARRKGLQVISLGKRILRAETAAISAVALVQFLLGDMAEGR
jgi:16S rRNA (uracil1498-N3)-methyltransferase